MRLAPPSGSRNLAQHRGNANLVPVVANGEVFVASYAQLQIFGLKHAGKKSGTKVTWSVAAMLVARRIERARL